MKRSGRVLVVSGGGIGSLAAATAAVVAAGHRHRQGTDEPRWPGKIDRELGKAPRVKDWEFSKRKGKPK